jgi:hypothetical protein
VFIFLIGRLNYTDYLSFVKAPALRGSPFRVDFA